MTLYIDADYYTETYHGTKLTGNDIEKYLKLAQEKVDSMTFNRIVKIGFNNLTDFQQEKIAEAICVQAEYIKENGTDDEQELISSYSVLDISVSVDSNNVSKAHKLHMSDRAYSLVHKTGLDCPII